MRRLQVALFLVVLVAGGCEQSDSPAGSMDDGSSTVEVSADGSAATPESTLSIPRVTTIPAPSTTDVIDDGGGDSPPGTVIPWDIVGEGWLLVLLEAEGRPVLAVTSPDGAPFEVMSWPSGSLLDETIVDWSPDRREVLVLLPGYDPVVSLDLWLVDLVAGEWSLVESIAATPSAELWGGFTRPSGVNLVVMVRDDSGVRLERRNRVGELLANLSSQPSGPMSWLYGPDGTTVVVADRAGVSLVSNQGEFIRTLMEPFPEPTVPLEDSLIGWCGVAGWWSDRTLLAACEVRAANPGSPVWGELWQIPVDGSQPVSVRTAPLSQCDDGPPGRPESMWMTGVGPLVEVVCPFGVGEDGPHRLGVFDLSTGTDRIEVAGASSDNRVVSVSSEEVVVVSVWNMGNATALVSARSDSDGSGLVMDRLLVPDVREVATPDRVVAVHRYRWFGPLPTIRDIVEPMNERLEDEFEANPDRPEWLVGPMRLLCDDEDRQVGRGDVFACHASAQTVGDPRHALDPLSVVFLLLDDTGHVAAMSGTDRPYSSHDLVEWYERSDKGLSCSDLDGSYFDTLKYWFLEGMPARMDADGDGVPCENAYAIEEIVWVLNGGEDW